MLIFIGTRPPWVHSDPSPATILASHVRIGTQRRSPDFKQGYYKNLYHQRFWALYFGYSRSFTKSFLALTFRNLWTDTTGTVNVPFQYVVASKFHPDSNTLELAYVWRKKGKGPLRFVERKGTVKDSLEIASEWCEKLERRAYHGESYLVMFFPRNSSFGPC